MSLAERKELLEKEISNLQYECSQLYFRIVAHKSGEQLVYTSKREKLAELTTELSIINDILKQ